MAKVKITPAASDSGPISIRVEAEILELEIMDLSRGGSGVGRRQDGRVVFVPYTAPGDRVRVKVLRDEGRYSHAELLEVLSPSAQRRNPACSVFGRCGGCQWQHLPYEDQWKVKREGSLYALKRVGVTAPEKIEEFPAQSEWGYRNRIQLRGARGSLGFFELHSRTLVPIESCPIARTEINQALPQVRTEGQLRTEDQYKVEIDVLPGESPRWFWNSRHGAGGFRQVNDEQNSKLRAWISANLKSSRRLFDLFGGSGNLSLPVADSMTRVDCVDTGSPGARDRPEGTPKNLIFHRADVAQWLKAETRKIPSVPKLDSSQAVSALLDPPREGCGPKISGIIEALLKLHCDEILAVGCDPDSWAKDVGRYIRAGFTLERVALFDFFPQTPHLESVALLRRTQSSRKV